MYPTTVPQTAVIGAGSQLILLRVRQELLPSLAEIVTTEFQPAGRVCAAMTVHSYCGMPDPTAGHETLRRCPSEK